MHSPRSKHNSRSAGEQCAWGVRVLNTDNTFAEPGRCACGARIVRGVDDTGELVDVDAPLVDAAAELLAYAAGRPSFTLALARPRGLTLTRRTRDDIKRRPAGFKRSHVVLLHACRNGER